MVFAEDFVFMEMCEEYGFTKVLLSHEDALLLRGSSVNQEVWF